MKKWTYLCLCILLAFSLTSCGTTIGAKTHEVESERYTQEEITSAIKTIKKYFRKNFQGCILKEIYYAGDDFSKNYQDFADRNNADEVIVLLSSFYVKPNGGDGSLNTNFTYDSFNWILVRTGGGEWIHIDHGY